MVLFMAETKTSAINRVRLTLFYLGDRELRALAMIAERLLMGQKLFGELSHGKKDWKKEASEEAFDMAVYLSALLVDQEDDDSEPVTERNTQ